MIYKNRRIRARIGYTSVPEGGRNYWIWFPYENLDNEPFYQGKGMTYGTTFRVSTKDLKKGGHIRFFSRKLPVDTCEWSDNCTPRPTKTVSWRQLPQVWQDLFAPVLEEITQ
jgi:hypothetical protein